MQLTRAFPLLLALGLSAGCQGFGTLGMKKSNDMTGPDAVAKLEANQPAGERLPEIVALPPSTPLAAPAPAYTATTAKAGSRSDGTTMAATSFDDEEIVLPPRKKAAPKKGMGGGEAPPSHGKIGAKPAPGPHPKTYVVQRGDTLQKISQKFYGTTKSWQKIFDANKAKMKKPDVVIAGMVLTIP